MTQLYIIRRSLLHFLHNQRQLHAYFWTHAFTIFFLSSTEWSDLTCNLFGIWESRKNVHSMLYIYLNSFNAPTKPDAPKLCMHFLIQLYQNIQNCWNIFATLIDDLNRADNRYQDHMVKFIQIWWLLFWARIAVLNDKDRLIFQLNNLQKCQF